MQKENKIKNNLPTMLFFWKRRNFFVFNEFYSWNVENGWKWKKRVVKANVGD
jgi:hypothetical protein